jgi:signal peptidase I
VVFAGLISFSALVGYWALTGGRWFVVETPSMGQAAPVGTLLWVKPVSYGSIRVGQIITFHPPETHETYSHRVVSINPDGTLSTRGDINLSRDPWKLQPRDVVGAVAMRWWGIGWVIEAAPLLAVGGIALWILISWFTKPKWKAPAAIVGIAVILTLAIVVYRPLVRADLLSFAPRTHGGEATYVSTGLLPTKLSAPGNGHIDLRDGQVGSILSTHPIHHHVYVAHLDPSVKWWWWLVLVGVCFSPALATFVVGRRRPHVDGP